MNFGYLENLVIIQEGLRFVTKILGLEYVLTTITTTTGTTMEFLSPILHATKWDILLAMKERIQCN